MQQGFTRILYKGEILKLNEINISSLSTNEEICIVVDRFAINPDDEDNSSRIADSVQTAFYEGAGNLIAELINDGGQRTAVENKPDLLVKTKKL